MKTFSKSRFASVLLLLVLTSTIYANPVTTKTSTPLIDESAKSAKSKLLLNRLNEINSIDKSNLSRINKKELRKEAKAIKSEIRKSNSGVYLSVGAIIIIVLILILIL